MVLVIASARGARVRIAPAKAVITSHFVRMTFSLRVQVASNEWKSGSIDPGIMSTTARNLSSRASRHRDHDGSLFVITPSLLAMLANHLFGAFRLPSIALSAGPTVPPK